MEKEKQAAGKKPHRFSLSLRINIITVCGILVATIGLVALLYRSNSRVVLDYFKDQTSNAAFSLFTQTYPDALDHFWEVVNGDEFKSVRAQAERQEDEQILIDWMKKQPGVIIEAETPNTFYDDVLTHQIILENTMVTFGMQSVYYQRRVGNVTYDLLRSDAPLWEIGQEVPVIEELDYGEGEDIPPTIYQGPSGWVCTSGIFLYKDLDKPVCYACADLDMSGVVQEQHGFLMNSLLSLIVLIGATLLVNMFLLRRMVTRPLKQIADGTTAFTEGNEDGYALDKVISLKMDRSDEIGDLYEAIRSMQTRIVTDTQKLKQDAVDKEHMQTELSLAARIQEMALPRIQGRLAGREEFSLDASMTPAKNVGGDFYDFFFLDNTHLVLLIADVSGKGIPAALFMMSAQNKIKSCASLDRSPAQILTAANIQLCENNDLCMFVTVWLGILDLATGRLAVSSAGHEKPILGRAGKAFELVEDCRGIVMGGMKNARYTDYEITLNPGDVLFQYTDGVPEASNSQNEFFGTDRMLEALNQAGERKPAGLLEQMRSAVDEFVGDAQQFDDLTMLCIRYQGADTSASKS